MQEFFVDPAQGRKPGSDSLIDPPPVSVSVGKEETVVGVTGVPQFIIDAERKANPLRRWRLGVYALAASAAGAQITSIIDARLSASSSGNTDNASSDLLLDFVVVVVGAVLWRLELSNRANNLQRIWKEAEFRVESLKRAEAGLGETLWTARIRLIKNPKGKGLK
eukprot:CAMPEP_0198213030 /NCGR_PEP_ID=MMETSP1445-20131203/28635_1 /TAXON_ID=36898 /ORGANISM="Pyramimonas sp., Strain CCMP2087" /LENGTH=164 /DNA_ID=CAMNT_0043887619 /DNA_START=291 /DNA_END=785 /DNA_ORIENTATION=+